MQLFAGFFFVNCIIQGFHGSKSMGSGTHCSNIDGFLGTHGTHANGATELVSFQSGLKPYLEISNNDI